MANLWEKITNPFYRLVLNQTSNFGDPRFHRVLKMSEREKLNMFRLMEPSKAAGILTEMSNPEAVEIVSKIGVGEAAKILGQMSDCDAVKIVDEMNARTAIDIFNHMMGDDMPNKSIPAGIFWGIEAKKAAGLLEGALNERKAQKMFLGGVRDTNKAAEILGSISNPEKVVKLLGAIKDSNLKTDVLTAMISKEDRNPEAGDSKKEAASKISEIVSLDIDLQRIYGEIRKKQVCGISSAARAVIVEPAPNAPRQYVVKSILKAGPPGNVQGRRL